MAAHLAFPLYFLGSRASSPARAPAGPKSNRGLPANKSATEIAILALCMQRPLRPSALSSLAVLFWVTRFVPVHCNGQNNSNLNQSYYAKELSMLVLINISDIYKCTLFIISIVIRFIW